MRFPDRSLRSSLLVALALGLATEAAARELPRTRAALSAGTSVRRVRRHHHRHAAPPAATSPETAAPAPPAADTLGFEVSFAAASAEDHWVTARLEGDSATLADLDPSSLRALGQPADLDGQLEDTVTPGHVARRARVVLAPAGALGPGAHLVCVEAATRGGLPLRGCGVLAVSARGGVERLDPARLQGPLAVRADTDRIVFHLGQPGYFALELLDARGRVVEQLARGFRGAGDHTMAWPGPWGALPPGRYIVRLRSDSSEAVTRAELPGVEATTVAR